jgi:hypothetical protein
MRVSSTCFRDRSDNERFFQTPEDSFGFKLYSISKGAVFAIGIFPPQYSPSSPFSFGTVRPRRMTLRVKVRCRFNHITSVVPSPDGRASYASLGAPYLIGLWPLILGLHRPCSQHATVPSTLSSEGQLLVYPPHFSGLTPTGERDSCATWAQYYGNSVTIQVSLVR